MTSPTPGPVQPPTPKGSRRVLLWVVVFGALAIGVALAILFGSRVTPFIDVAR
ncbi:MAG: hypothetical protein AB1762_19495 [Gemmatimonadota bacterium]